MFDSIIIYLFYTLIATTVGLGFINMLRANLADLRLARVRHDQARHPSTKHRRQRPLLSVIVFAHNDAAAVGDCLGKLLASSYRKLEIVVIDNASTDDTKQLVRKFITAHPKREIRLIAKRRATDRDQALASASRHIHGELVMVIDAGSFVEHSALRSGVSLLAEPAIDTVLANSRPAIDYSLLGIARRSQTLATVWNKKGGGHISPGLDDYNYAAFYTRDVFTSLIRPSRREALSSLNNLRQQVEGVVYDSASIMNVYTTHPHLTTQLIGRLWRGIVYVAEPAVIGFMIYVAARFGQTGYLLLAWASFSSLLLLAIWSDDSSGFWAKLGQTTLVPITYALYLLERLRVTALIIKPARA